MDGVIFLYLVPRYEEMKSALWCPSCLKPSGFELVFDRISAFGVTANAMTLRKCNDCGSPL
ncbi:hypothetical protein AWB94_06515 [Mycolicibacterium canariasense]|nr:hypothetical protein AWB94_06515 [Mycolicibacterium canariasense]